MQNQESNGEEFKVSGEIKRIFDTLLSNASIKKSLDFIKKDHDYILNEQKKICAISAPTFQEQRRAETYLKRFTDLGLEDTEIDSIGNVLGYIRGNGDGPKLVVAAHLDTVFPEEIDTKVTEKEGIFYAPGIADDTRGLVELLSIIRALKENNIQLLGDIVFCGTVSEEGLGNLRGVKQLFSDHKDIDGFISIDGTGIGTITYLATGSHRYQVTYEGPGGHSYNNFGLPSAIHAAGRAIASISDLRPPKEPKTTFTIGTIHGGTSVNAIAAKAEMLIDIRSNSEKELLKLEAKILPLLQTATDKENERWSNDLITVSINLLGDRPAGLQSSKNPIVQAAYAAGIVLEIKSQLSPPGSTDANIPINLGIPAIAIGRGGTSGGIHTKKEWFNPKNAFLGPQRTLLIILSLVGVRGVNIPLLKKISRKQ